MEQQKYEYTKRVKAVCPPSPLLWDCCKAFAVGGMICAVGEILRLFFAMKLDEKQSSTAVAITLITAASLLTGIGVFDKIAKFAGAGTLVPITGFANAMVAPAVEFRSEGLIFGVGVKLFSVAGPVIVYGTLAAVLYGILYWILLTCGVVL